MSRTNMRKSHVFEGVTHEGARARKQSAREELERALLSCLLWERTFYEDGEEIGKRIARLVAEIPDTKYLHGLAVRARQEHGLRHAPLLLAREIARRHRSNVGKLLPEVIRRADELAEFLALYWKDGRQPLSKQVKLGLARAFRNFDAYQLGKYNREGIVRLRDVLFLTHAKPKDKAQEKTWKQLVDGTLPVPDTWEVRLSGGEDKCAVFTDLIERNRLGALALVRNLRGMVEAGVSDVLIRKALLRAKTRGVLPFQFLAAARATPQFERELEVSMLASVAQEHPVKESAVILVDVSGSMERPLSERGSLSRLDAAGALAALLRETHESVRVFTFSHYLVEVPARGGFALMDAISQSQPHDGTYLGRAVKEVNALAKPEVLYVVTDEQSHDTVGGPSHRGYLMNVAPYRPSVSWGPWVRVNGWSDAIVRFILAVEGARA